MGIYFVAIGLAALVAYRIMSVQRRRVVDYVLA